MDNALENEAPPVRKPAGLITKGVSLASGFVLGAGAMVLSINSSISSNLRKFAEPAFTRMRDMRKQAGGEEDGWSPLADKLIDAATVEARFDLAKEIQGEMRRTFHNNMLGNIPGELKIDIAKGEKAIGKAYKKAREADSIVNFGSDKTRRKIMDNIQRRGLHNEGSAGELTAQRFKEILFDVETMNMDEAIRGTPKHIPLKDRLLLSSELHLTGQQKALAGLAFAGVAAVAAGVMYYGIKHFKTNKEKIAEAHQAGLI